MNCGGDSSSVAAQQAGLPLVVLSQRYGAINLHPSLVRAPPFPAGEGRGEGSHKRALDESVHSLGNGCNFPPPYRIVPNTRRAQSQPEDSRDSRPDLSGNPPIRTILLAKNRLPLLKKSSNSSLSTFGTPAAMAVVGASSVVFQKFAQELASDFFVRARRRDES